MNDIGEHAIFMSKVFPVLGAMETHEGGTFPTQFEDLRERDAYFQNEQRPRELEELRFGPRVQCCK